MTAADVLARETSPAGRPGPGRAAGPVLGGVVISIFATFLTFDDDEGPPPIVYRGSHILPSDDDERGGLVALALIPSFIADGGDGPEDEAPLPWLRLSVAARIVTEQDAQPGEIMGTAPAMQDVILDASQVRWLRDALTGWFHAPEMDGARSWACKHCGGTGEEPGDA